MKRRIGFGWVICAASITVSAQGGEPLHFAADRPVDCLHIKLNLNVDVANKYVSGTARIDVAALREVSTITLDAKDLDITAVKLVRQGYEPAPANYINSGEQIEVLLDEPLITGQQASIIVEYSVDDPPDGLHFFGPAENEPDVSYVVWSQGESTYNSHWFPCFDNPNERQTTELVITTKRGFEASGNGRLISRTEDTGADTATFHWLQDKPHPAYLVSMVVGDFHIERDTWRGKPVTYWSHPPYKDRIKRTFKNTKRMLDFFSDAIGIEYPWDRYAQICCEGFGGGMENTSAATLGTRSLHDERSIIDSDSDGLIAHELAHQWWGDLLTCSDWAHIWLNEGFASYFEALWDEHDLGDDEFRYNMYRKAGRAKRGGTKAPIVDRAYKSPGSMFDSRAYSKGAWVLHMMRKRIGDSLFWQVMKKYGTDNAYKTVETVDLRKAVEAVTGRSFERFFYDWTERPGHPEVTVTYKWLNDDKLAKVSIKQTQEADAFHFPLTLEFRFDDATGPVSVTRDITEKELSFYYPFVSMPKMLRVDPDQTVLMELKEKKGKDLWKAQLGDDPNPVARIRAAKHFGESKSKADRKLLAKSLESEKFWGVQREIARALGDTRADVARDALISGLKSENHKTRRACVEQLAKFHQDPVAIDAVRPIVEKGDASYYVEAAALETFAELEPEGALAVLTKALKRDSRNEVIRSSALSALGDVRDEKVIDVLTEWTRTDKPRQARPAAIRALAKVTKRTLVDDEHMQQIVDALEACLDDRGRWVRSSAVRALGGLSDPGKAKSALPALKTLVAGESSERVRKAAERTIDAIESGKPVQVQLADMRKDLKAAMEQYDELVERFDKFESSIKSDVTESEDKEVASAGSDDASGQEE